MKERKVTQEELAVVLDISQSSVGHYVSGRRNPRKELLEKIAEELDVSLDWLIGKSDVPPIDKRDFYSVPVLDAASAAADHNPSKEEEKAMEYTPISTDWITKQGYVAQDLCICFVEDEAMSPKLNKGDKVIINKGCKHFINGGVFALLEGSELHIRRTIKRLDKTWIISSDNTSNPTYRDEVFTHDDLSSFQIIGRVVLAITSL
jgi:phage repressor protein C with HTH and peptisase S24 domain